MQGANQELPAERRPMIGKNVHTRRIVASAASLAAMAAAVATGVVLSRASPIKMVERMPDNGEDYFSAIEQPHKIYEWPWLRDQKFQYQARVLGYGPPETWGRSTGWNEGYKRTAFDEYGDRAFDVDMRPAQSCYDADSFDCYREQFDPDTGYLREDE